MAVRAGRPGRGHTRAATVRRVRDAAAGRVHRSGRLRLARRNSVICPYHAWTCTLSGELSFAPALNRKQEFDGSAWGLVELPAGEWCGLIFVDSSGGQAGALADTFASLDELVAPYEPERLAIAGRHPYDIASNWKILSENYHECYTRGGRSVT